MKAGENTGDAFVLKYCADEFGSSLGLESGTEVTYAAYYPGEMLSSISGMTISSVDVYVYDPSETSEIVIYGEKSQSANGEAICTQTFTPIADSWNHIELENPVEITGNDLWIGAKFGGFEPATYQIGVDNGPSVIGFADRVNVGGSTWWSLADLGQDGNILIKANVTGERTVAIDWLDIDKTNVSIEQGEEEDVSLTFSTAGLEGTLYEAGEGTITLYPYQMWGYSNVRVVDMWYIRFNDFSLSYDLPERWIKGFAQSVRISAFASNPLQIKSKDLKGRDPEVAMGSQPRERTFSLGVDITF